jgi:hypothetical protein
MNNQIKAVADREAFEDTFSRRGYDIRRVYAHYNDENTEFAYRGWQAAIECITSMGDESYRKDEAQVKTDALAEQKIAAAWAGFQLAWNAPTAVDEKAWQCPECLKGWNSRYHNVYCKAPRHEAAKQQGGERIDKSALDEAYKVACDYIKITFPNGEERIPHYPMIALAVQAYLSTPNHPTPTDTQQAAEPELSPEEIAAIASFGYGSSVHLRAQQSRLEKHANLVALKASQQAAEYEAHYDTRQRAFVNVTTGEVVKDKSLASTQQAAEPIGI